MTDHTAKRPRPERAIKARRADSEAKVQAVERAIRALARAGLPITVSAVATHAQVSRSFVYDNPDAAKVFMAASTRSKAKARAHRDEAMDAETAPWRERALNAEDALRLARSQLVEARREVADLLGQLRDPDGTWLREDRERLLRERETLTKERNELRQSLRRAETQRDSARSVADRLRSNNVRELFPDGPGPAASASE
jgi:small-conductance mechanosensitive channel